MDLFDGGTGGLIVATGQYIGEGFDCPPLDKLFVTLLVCFKGSEPCRDCRRLQTQDDYPTQWFAIRSIADKIRLFRRGAALLGSTS